jgi:LCP family protein required for cell wall assembly
MPNGLTKSFEALLILVVIASIAVGATWMGGSPINTGVAQSLPLAAAPANGPAPGAQPAAAQPDATATGAPADAITATATADGATALPELTATLGLSAAAGLQTPVPFDSNIPADRLEPGDAPLLEQAPGTINFLLLGSDVSADNRFARTDTIIVASVNPDIPSVSMLSIPRDVHVRIPGQGKQKINTAFELGYMNNEPGGGPGFLALVMRKNFGIRIDHFVRIDFDGFVKAVDTLGGVEVLVECELHDTFPSKANPRKGIDFDVYPGKVTLTGQEALWYARSRWSTSDFDRARRQQKVLRAAFRKARDSNLFSNAISLFTDLRSNIETDIGLGDLPAFVDIARRLDDITLKNRVITFPIVKTLVRQDGQYVLEPQPGIQAYIAEALAPPVANRAQNRIAVEVYNGSSKTDMELIAAERLTWEGFLVLGKGVLQDRFDKTQIVDYGTVPKGSPIARLSSIFNVKRANVIGQADPSSPSAARIVLGEDYNSCPNTASIAGEVPVAPLATAAP